MIATTATLGIVYLPGMMTGQILGGMTPLTAVVYQIMIMTAITVSTVISTILTLLLSLKIGFDSMGLLKSSIFIKSQNSI